MILIPILGWESKTVFRNRFRMVSLFSFSQFSCEKLKRVAPSEAVPGFSDGVTTRYYNFYISLFFPTSLLLLINATRKKRTRNLPLSIIQYHGDDGAAEIVPKHNEDSRGRGKRNIGEKLGSVRVISMKRRRKKHEPSLQKPPFVPGRAEPMHIE